MTRDDLFIKLWQQHAPIPWLWPHDEPFDRWLRSAIPAVFFALKTTEQKSATYLYHLRNLLAVIHHDGGCYTATHGVEKSTEDAIARIIALYEKTGE